jgi:hypothetical protein
MKSKIKEIKRLLDYLVGAEEQILYSISSENLGEDELKISVNAIFDIAKNITSLKVMLNALEHKK